MEEFEPQIELSLNSSKGGFAYSAAAVFMIFVTLIFSVILSAVPKYGYAYWFLSFIGSPIAIAGSVAFTLKAKKLNYKQIFPVKCHPKYYFIGILLVFGLFFSLNQINSLILSLFNIEESESSLKLDEFIMGLNGGWVVLALIVIAVLPAFFEEVLFRGTILNNCNENVGGLRSIFIVGLVFSLYHGSPEQTVYQFLAGCLFAFVAIRSGSIIPGIIMHFLNNALVIVLASCGAISADGYFFNKGAHIALMVVGAVALAAGLFLLIFDKNKLKPYTKGSVKSFFVPASVGIIILAIVWIVNLVVLF